MRGQLLEAGIIKLVSDAFGKTADMTLMVLQNLFPLTIIFILFQTIYNSATDPYQESWYVYTARAVLSLYVGLWEPVTSFSIPYVIEIQATNAIFELVLLFATVIKRIMWGMLWVMTIWSVWQWQQVINSTFNAST